MRRVARIATMAAALAVASSLLMAAGQDGSPSAIEVQLELADLLYDEGRYREALEAYERAKVSTDSLQRRRAVSGLVQAALRLARFGVARGEADGLRRDSPLDPGAIALQGDALWAYGLFAEAEAAYDDALAREPDNSRANHGRARALAAKMQFDEALAQAQVAIHLDPRRADLHHLVGSIYERMHRFEDAAAAYGNYVNLLPNKHRSDKAAWSRAEIRFLRSFGRRVPFELEDDRANAVHTVDFRLIRDKIVVKARLNDREIDVVLDTGAEQTVLSRGTASRLGVTPVVYTLSAGVGNVGLRGLQLGRLDTFEIGSLKMSNVPCLIKSPSLAGLPTREPDSFSPVALGLSVTIDYQRRKLTMGRRVEQHPDDIELPLRVQRLAMVRGMVNNEPASFVLDTGGQVISIGANTADAVSANNEFRRIPLKVYGTSGWDRDAFLLPGIDLQFDRIFFPNFPVVVLNLRAPSALLGFRVGGIVGHKFLSKYRVGIDLENSVVRLREIEASPVVGP